MEIFRSSYDIKLVILRKDVVLLLPGGDNKKDVLE